MNKADFLQVMRDDLVTDPEKATHEQIFMVVEWILGNSPDDVEINSEKTLAGAYKHMYSNAAKKKQNNVYAYTPADTIATVSEYLGVNPPVFAGFNNSAPAPVAPNSKTIGLSLNLEDYL